MSIEDARDGSQRLYGHETVMVQRYIDANHGSSEGGGERETEGDDCIREG